MHTMFEPLSLLIFLTFPLIATNLLIAFLKEDASSPGHGSKWIALETAQTKITTNSSF